MPCARVELEHARALPFPVSFLLYNYWSNQRGRHLGSTNQRDFLDLLLRIEKLAPICFALLGKVTFIR